MLPKISDVIEVDKKIYIVTDIIQNEKGAPIIIWACKKDIGGCIPSRWREWKKGFDPHRRRGQIIGAGNRVPGYEFYKARTATRIAMRRAESQRLS